ncbi:hypothetical protein EJD97_010859, partial [Solanum chilense]
NHDHLCDDIWSHLDWNDHQVESGETEGNKLLDPTESDTCQPLKVINGVVEVSVNVAKKRSSTNRKKMADKSKIVYEAANRILKLQNTFNKLKSQKLERLEENNIMLMSSQKVGNSLEKYAGDQGSICNSKAITPTNHGPTGFMTCSSPNVILNVSGEDAHISVCCPKKPGLFTTICYVLEKHKIDIVSAQISSDQFRSMFMIQAHSKGESGVAQLSEGFTVEDMYKQAANEIMLMTTPK